MDVLARTAANRRLVADFFDDLDQEQLETASLCQAWTVREVLGHLVMPMTGSLGGFVLKVVRAGGSVNRASEETARELARRPVSELTALLRDKADEHGMAPGVGPMGQMTDGCVHLRDCARPLGLPDDVSADDWRMVLDWLPTGVPAWCRSAVSRGCQYRRPTKTGPGVRVTRSSAPARRWRWRYPAVRSPSTISPGRALNSSDTD